MANSKKPKPPSTLLQDLSGLFFLFLFLFTMLSLCSYSSQDPSFFTSARGNARNLAGVMGSHWSSLLWQVFGASGFMLATIFLLAGIALFRRIGKAAWSLAAANFLLLLFATAACFGLVRKPLVVGGSRFSMGGITGDLLGGFLESYLNTAGAALLCFFLFVFAVSLSLKVSVRDLGLYTWLAVSRTGMMIAGVLLYLGMQAWAALSQGYAELKPLVADYLVSAWDQITELFHRKEKEENEKPAKEEKIAKKDAVIISPPRLVAKDGMVVAPPALLDEEDGDLDDDFSPAGKDGPDIILSKTDSAGTLFDAPGEMEVAAGEKAKFSPLMSFVKKAAKENERP